MPLLWSDGGDGSADDRRASGNSSRVDSTVLVYENTPELLAFVVPFIKRGLAEGALCVYVFDDLTREEISEALAGQAVDVGREAERGALSLLAPEEWYGPSPFGVYRSLERLRRRAQDARTGGFTGLRVAVEMTWTLRAGVDGDTLAIWESLIEQADCPGPTIVAWMFRRARFDPALLRQVMRSHGRVIAGDYVHLSLSALFHSLAPTSLREWVRSAKQRRVASGGFYFRQDEAATRIYFLTEGTVELVRTERDGRTAILRVIIPEQPFGYVNALEGTPRIASAQAIEDCRALGWDVPTVLHKMMAHPEVSLNTIRVLAEDVRIQVDRAQDLATSRVEQRLARLLLRFAQSVGRRTARGIVVPLVLSGEELGGMIGATPYTISRVLADWRRLDVVNAQRQRMLILDPDRLAAVAGDREAVIGPKARERKSGARPGNR